MTRINKRTKSKPHQDDRASKLRLLLDAGQAAKAHIYRDLLAKIEAKQTLKPSEIRALASLEREIEAELSGGSQSDTGKHTYDQAATYCGFSKRTLNWHVSRGNLKQGPDGKFDETELDRFLTAKGRKGGGGTAKERADLRYKLARARREEMLVAQLKGTLIDRSTAEKLWSDRAHELAKSLFMLSRTIGHQVAAASEQKLADVMAIIDARVKEMVLTYSRPADGIEG